MSLESSKEEKEDRPGEVIKKKKKGNNSLKSPNLVKDIKPIY